MDLRLSPRLAGRIDSDALAGTAVGTVEIEAAAAVEGDCVDPQFDLRKDALMTAVEEIQQTAREAGVRVALTPSVSLHNVGEADIEWYGPFSGQHPYLVWSLYRITDDEISQLGQSDVKHGYFATNSDCPCAPAQIFWVGCSDTYTALSNENQYYLGPRDEIEAHSGLWEECGSHFDGPNGDCVRSPQVHEPFDHRLIVAESDLQEPAGAEYQLEAFYIIKDDVDIFNTMGHVQIEPTLSGETWTFPALAPLALGPAVDAWVDPSAAVAGSANHTIGTGEGHLQLAVKTLALGGGAYRYTYALMNHDFDRQIQAFQIPVAPGAGVGSTTFRDLDDDPGNDWLPTVAPEGWVEWQAPDSESGLDWGTLFGFSFEGEMEPVETYAELTILETGDGTTLYIPTLGGSESPWVIFADGFETGDTSRWSAP
jgi:hypothetical protein